MCLHPAVSLDDLFGKGSRGQDLRHQRIRIESDRRYQLLQLRMILIDQCGAVM